MTKAMQYISARVTRTDPFENSLHLIGNMTWTDGTSVVFFV